MWFLFITNNGRHVVYGEVSLSVVGVRCCVFLASLLVSLFGLTALGLVNSIQCTPEPSGPLSEIHGRSLLSLAAWIQSDNIASLSTQVIYTLLLQIEFSLRELSVFVVSVFQKLSVVICKCLP